MFGSYGCDHCHFKFQHRNNLITHVEVVHQKLKLYKCTTEEFENYQEDLKNLANESNFMGELNLKRNKENQNDDDEDETPKPKEKAGSPTKVKKSKNLRKAVLKREHFKSVAVEDEFRRRNHECDKCGKGFGTKNRLKSHMATHENDENKNGDNTNEKESKNDDLTEKFEDPSPPPTKKLAAQCQLCEKSFKNQCLLNFHVKKNHQVQGGNAKMQDSTDLKCQVCGKKFVSKMKLDVHVKSFH